MSANGQITCCDGRRVAVEPAEQELGGGAAELGRIVRHDGDGRIEQIGEREVVESDDRDLVLQPERAERLDRADREVVLAREDRRRRVGRAKHLADHLLGVLHRDHARPDVGASAAASPSACIASVYPWSRSRAVPIVSAAPRYAIRR